MRLEMTLKRAFILSLITHLLILSLLQYIPSEWTQADQHQPITEVVILETPPEPLQNQRQVVREALAPEKVKLDDDQSLARFISANKQRVLIETKAQNTGLTKNSDGLKQKSWLREVQRKIEQNSAPQKAEKDFSGYKPINLPKIKDLANAEPSTVGEVLPTDVSIGSFTALNTDRYTFYSFYARVEELVRFRWESRVYNSIDTFDRNYVLSVVGNRDWITKVEFLLDRNGKLVQSRILKSSGIKKFDLAAIQSFQEAHVFPNPPQDLIEPDGYVHLQYSFTVHFNPSPIVSN